MRSLAGRIGASMISIGLLTSVAARPPRPWQPISDERRSHLTGPVLDGGPREADAGTHCQGNKAAEGCFRKPDLWDRATRTLEIPPRPSRNCRKRPDDWSQSRFA